MTNTHARIADQAGRTSTARRARRTEDLAMADRHVATHIGGLAVGAAPVDTRTERVAVRTANLAASSFDFPADAFMVAMCVETMVACAARLALRAGRIATSTGDSGKPAADIATFTDYSDRPTADSATSAGNTGSADEGFAVSDEDLGTRDGHSGTPAEDVGSRVNSSLTGAGRLPSPNPNNNRSIAEENVMRHVDTLRYEMLVRVRDFGAAHSTAFPEGTLGIQLFAEVNTAVEELGQHAATEVSGRGAAREGTSTKALARSALHQQLEAINRTARALAVETPGLDDKFRMPRRWRDQALLASARAFAQDAEALAPAFIAHAMPKSFLTDLDNGIAAYEQALRDHQAGKGRGITAGAHIRATLQAGFNAVVRLDAVVANQLRDDPSSTTLWESIRRVEHPPRARRRRVTSSTTPANGGAAAAPTT